MIRSIQNSILESTGILEVQVQLASLGVIGLLCPGPNVCLESIETVRDNLSHIYQQTIFLK
jgi:hypothetical protein